MLPVLPYLLNSPADILSEFLIKHKVGVKARIPPTDWQIECLEVGYLPQEPDNLIACCDTQGRNFGSLQESGESIEQYGIQIRIRSISNLYGNAKAFQIRNYLDAIHNDPVTLQGVNPDGKLINMTYTLISAAHKGILSSGKEKPSTAGQESSRSLFSVNALVYVKIA